MGRETFSVFRYGEIDYVLFLRAISDVRVMHAGLAPSHGSLLYGASFSFEDFFHLIQANVFVVVTLAHISTQHGFTHF